MLSRLNQLRQFATHGRGRRAVQAGLAVGLLAAIVLGLTIIHVWSSGGDQRMPKSSLTTGAAPAYGIAAGSSLTSLSSSELSSRLSGIAATGATWIRFDFDWSLIQPDNAQSFNWTTYDAIVATAKADHLSILGILDYTPMWARAASCTASAQCPPASPSQFANFAAAVAHRYGSEGVHDWEVWNEPNNPSFWQPAADPQAYTQLLQHTYSALHTVDPEAEVMTGGLAPEATTAGAYAPVAFLTAIYNDGGQSDFDAVADHPYTFPLTPTSDANDAWTQMAASQNSLRSLMVAKGDGSKKIWITEFGAPTGGPGPVATPGNLDLGAKPFVVNDALQAQDLSDALSLYKTYSWAGPFFYYSYQDAGTDPSTNENFFGLLTYSGTPKPAYNVFKQAALGH